MIEKIVLDYLSEKLDVPVYMEVPEELPTDFVVVEKTGSSEENRIYSAMVVVQSYATSLLEAAERNEAVKTAMDELIELNTVCSCQLNSDYNYTDTASKRYRYQAVFDIVHY